MIAPAEMSSLMEALRPHALSVALVAARLGPAVFLLPLLGGQVAPATVRLSLCLVLALHVHFAGGVGAAHLLTGTALDVAAAFAFEAMLGIAMGLVAALPFDAARMAGRFLDTFRGANAESTLPVTGSRESATADLLHQLVCAVACVGPSFGLLVAALGESFRAVPLAATPIQEGTLALLDLVITRCSAALATGLAIGAPIAALSLLVEVVVGIASRVAPAISLRDLAAPAKLLLGGAAILLLLGGASQRLLRELGDSAASIRAAAELLGGGQ